MKLISDASGSPEVCAARAWPPRVMCTSSSSIPRHGAGEDSPRKTLTAES